MQLENNCAYTINNSLKNNYIDFEVMYIIVIDFFYINNIKSYVVTIII